MTENHRTCPMTVYGAAKLAGECYARAFYETYKYPTTIVRAFNSFGPRCHHEGDSGEVIPKFLLRCMAGRPLMIFGDGTQTRDFTFVSDTARGIVAAGLSEKAIGKTLNIGNGNAISINEVAQKAIAVSGAANVEIIYEKPRPGDVLCLHADTTMASNLIGYKPVVSLNDGLNMLMKWYLSQNIPPEKLLESEQVMNWLD